MCFTSRTHPSSDSEHQCVAVFGSTEGFWESAWPLVSHTHTQCSNLSIYLSVLDVVEEREASTKGLYKNTTARLISCYTHKTLHTHRNTPWNLITLQVNVYKSSYLTM